MSGSGPFADAVFRINGSDYQLAESALKDTRFRDFDKKFQQDGTFAPNSLNGTLHGTGGKFDGCEVTTYKGTVCVLYNNEYYDLNKLMATGQEVKVS